MSEKGEKSSHKKKTDKLSVGRKYAVFSPQSITILAESCGITGLSEEVASKIGEDVSYRLREIIQGCSVHLRTSKEKKLRSIHVANNLPKCSETQVYGYLSGGSADFIHVPGADLFVSEDNEIEVNLIDVAFSNEVYEQKEDIFVKGMWFLPDENCPSPTLEASTSSSVDLDMPHVPSHLVLYYMTFAKTILCKHQKAFCTVLKDLMCNSKIGLVVPFFLNLLTEVLQDIPRSHMACERVLQMIQALTLNPYVYRDATIIISGLITTLLAYSLDPYAPETMSATKDFELRDLAAEALTKVVEFWYGSDSRLLRNIVQKLASVLLDGSSSLRSHYGALATLCVLGDDAVGYCLWPHLEQYLQFVDVLPVDIESVHLNGPILTAAEILYHQDIDNLNAFDSLMRLIDLDRLLYSHYGDALCARRRLCGRAFFHESITQTRVDDTLVANSKDGDFELEYRNWTAIAKLPNRLTPLMSRDKHRDDLQTEKNQTLLLRESSIEKIDISCVFEKYNTMKSASEIQFKSIWGLPPWQKKLKRKLVDTTSLQFVGPSPYAVKCTYFGYVGKMMKRHIYPRTHLFMNTFNTSL